MFSSIEEALADCLEKMETGEATLEEALSLYPGLRAELEPLLSLAAELSAMPKVEAPASLRGYKRPVFRGEVAKARPLGGWRRFVPLAAPSFGWTTPLVRAAAALAIVVVAASGTVVASANSLPEQPLYPVKLAVENAQLALAPSDQARAELELQFAAARVAEVQRAAQQDDPAAVAQGAALYEQKVNAAVKAAQAASQSAPTVSEKVETSVRQNVQALEEVQQRLQAAQTDNRGNERAQSAIATAIARSEAASTADKESHGKSEEASGKPAAQAVATASVSPTPTTAAPANVAASDTTTPEPANGHEPPGKAVGRPENPGNSGNSGQTGGAAGKPQNTGQQGGAPGHESKPDSQQQKGEATPAVSAAATPSAPTLTPTATATPSAAALAPAPTMTATPTAAPPAAPSSQQPTDGNQGAGHGNSKDRKPEESGKDNLNQDLLSRILIGIQNLVPSR